MVTTQTDENQLLTGALALDNRTLGEIHDRYFPEIYRYAFLRTRDEAEAQDIAAEVFLQLLTAVHKGRPPHTTLRGWLYGVASHLVADHFHGGYVIPLSEFHSDGFSTQAEVEKNLRRNELRMAIQHLTAEQQEVLALRFEGGFSVEETAQMMDRSVTAVKALQFRAVDTLRRALAEVGDE